MKEKNHTKNEFMELGAALERVLFLAGLYLETCKPEQLPELYSDYKMAIDTVEDFVVNNFGEE